MRFLFIALFILSFAAMSTLFIGQMMAQESLEAYKESLERSCVEDDDCEIKNMGNCCGYYPECLNENADTDPERVMEICAEQNLGGVCGFPSINDCQCVDNKCKAIIN